MIKNKQDSLYFHEYYLEWLELYKHGAVRPVTYEKYLMTLYRLKEIAPHTRMSDLSRKTYQQILNEYAKNHEKQTTQGFHHHLRSAIVDAVDEGILSADPTRKVIIKGTVTKTKRMKFLSQHELISLLDKLNLSDKPNWDWLILLSAKTGLRFGEVLALTPSDFKFCSNKIKVTKTWNYKSSDGGFAEMKNYSSKRVVDIDDKLSLQFSGLAQGLQQDKPIFVNGRVFNSTVNSRLKTLCNMANVPVVSLHSLRHTHASLLIFAGVSIGSIAKRLGHANTTTTQDTYLHIIKELEDIDSIKILDCMSMLV